MIHIGEEGAQKTDTSNLQGNAQTVVITSAFSDKFLVCFMNHGSLAAANRGVAEYELSE
ncbi:hypothetical protein QJ166_24230 [Escherichia coli]|nr:hypothetical protein [Escherichia coli]MDK2528251.1 hypothetical protein [Escherichia coli]